MKKTVLDEINRLCSDKDYSQALALIRDVELSDCSSSVLLTKKAMCLQLVDDNGPLDEVERTFEAALNLDPRSVEALVEFGWFQLNVKDDAQRAESLFRRALDLQASTNTEIIIGIAKCRRDISPAQSPTVLVVELKRALFDERRLNESFVQQ
jgi:hypothetical protein